MSTKIFEKFTINLCKRNGNNFCLISAGRSGIFSLKLNYEVREMDWMLEGLLQGTQFQTLYNRKIEALRAEYHLRKIDIDILYFLYKSGERNTSKDISSLNLFNKGHISQSVDRMVKQQLIYAVPDRSDRRCRHLMLTEQAAGLVAQVSELRMQMYNIILNGVTEEEKKVLLQVSGKVNQNMKDALCNRRRYNMRNENELMDYAIKQETV